MATARKKPAKPKTERKKSAVLTDKQEKYVEARLDGKTKVEAGKLAGYSGANMVVEKSDDVAKALAAAREQLTSATQVKRADVIEMLKEAYDMAKLSAEPASMVSAAREIGKMLGYYEPETIKLEMSRGQSNLQSKFMIMSDEDLMEIAEGTAKVIEGEFKRLS